DNIVIGNNGNNHLDGGAGNDTLAGGRGSDTLTGGEGADRFVLVEASHSRPGAADRITDFTGASAPGAGDGDLIVLAAIDADTTTAGDQAFVLDAGGSFTAGEIRQCVVGSDLLIELNTDADAEAEMSLWLTGHTQLLGAGDFVL
ncbi:MAG: hypothetical protein SFW09_22310, partial [Hyphomicrobiaceae bacterium]|nr:hypothetical protein [Hyphomicrobiaceae bacterium]